MARKNVTVQKEVFGKALEESNSKMTFDKEEMSIIKGLAGKNNEALGVVNDIILAHDNEKGYVMDILNELFKRNFAGDSLISLYEDCGRDVELLIWNMEEGKLDMLRR